MHKGRLAGESIDLFHVLRDMRLPESIINRIQPVLTNYEIELDDALNRRNASFVDAQRALLDSITSMQEGMDTSVAERQITLRVDIRTVNDNFRESITEALPAEVNAEFRQLALERAYPSIYRKTMLCFFIRPNHPCSIILTKDFTFY